MKAPFPSLTETWHNTSYSAISPTRPELSLTEKTVIITGGGRGIGVDIARAFAAAGAAHVILIGRTQSTLSQSAEKIQNEFSSVMVSTYAADVADEHAIGKVAAQVKKWDVLILNAGMLADPMPVEKSAVVDWWRIFETNVKGAMVTTRAFLPFRNPGASIVGINANMIAVPVASSSAAGASAYTCSKFAQARLLEYVAAENEDLFVVSVHPGVIESDMLRQSAIDVSPERIDDVSLPAHFLVWVVSDEARFLKGKYVCANWDVDELKQQKERIVSSRILEMAIHGWPYGRPMDAMLARAEVEAEADK